MQLLSGLSWGVSAWGTPELKGKVVWTERGKGYRTQYGTQRRRNCIGLTMGSLEEEEHRGKGRDLGVLEWNKGGKTQ